MKNRKLIPFEIWIKKHNKTRIILIILVLFILFLFYCVVVKYGLDREYVREDIAISLFKEEIK